MRLSQLCKRIQIVMWETLFLEVVKNVVVPEIAQYVKKRYEETGQWPTKAELDSRVQLLAEEIKRNGNEFLNRPSDNRG